MPEDVSILWKIATIKWFRWPDFYSVIIVAALATQKEKVILMVIDCILIVFKRLYFWELLYLKVKYYRYSTDKNIDLSLQKFIVNKGINILKMI